jgi:preprotein translocase subunit SecA
MQFKHEAAPGVENEAEEPQGEPAAAAPAGPITREGPKVGRNDPCPCGSGKKYKQCHGSIV